MMRMLVACEFSGTTRDAFAARGWDAWSCDLEGSERGGNHIQGDALEAVKLGWDLLIAHPPCTYLTVTGNKWFKPEWAHRFPNRHIERRWAVDFFLAMINAPVQRIAVENPVGIMSTRYREPDQVIHPFHFGDSASKATCLWLKNLPLLSIEAPLFHTSKVVDRGEFVTFKSGKRMAKWDADAAALPPKERAKVRNRTFAGIAESMAEQWST